MRLLNALAAGLLASRQQRAPPPACGLLDWMLADVPSKPPIETLCRPEGYDLVCRFDGRARTVGAGVRFFCTDECELATPRGTVSLVSPSPYFAESGSWSAIDDGMSIRWRLETTALCDADSLAVVPPGAALVGTFRLTADAGASALLSEGVLLLETGVVGGERRVGACEATPMPLMGSN